MAFSEQVSFESYESGDAFYVINKFYFQDPSHIHLVVYYDDGTITEYLPGPATWEITGRTITRHADFGVGNTTLIFRQLKYQQLSSYKNASITFDREQLESDLDYVTMLAQNTGDIYARAIVAPLFDTSNMDLPIIAERENRFMTFDAAGNLLVRPLSTEDIGAATLAWQSTYQGYDRPGTSWLVTHNGRVWLSVVPINGTAPSPSTPAEWFLITTDYLTDNIWQPDLQYVHNTIISHNHIYYYVTNGAGAAVGVAPNDTSGDWKRWTETSYESLTATGAVSAGRPDHVSFIDTSSGDATITLTDGLNLGDKVTVASSGGGVTTVLGADLENQLLADSASVYLWNGSGWAVLSGSGGGGAGGGLEVGELTWWAGPSTTSIPLGKLVADGSIVNIQDYPRLFSKLGTTWGGDGVTTFGVPNLSGIYPGAEGTQDIGGTVYGTAGVIGAYEQDDLKPHSHIQNAHIHTQNTHVHSMGTHRHRVKSRPGGSGATCANLGYGAARSGLGSAGDNSPPEDHRWYDTDTGNHQLIEDTNPGDTNTTAAVNQNTTAVNQNSTGTQTRPATAIGRWIIQAEAAASQEVNAIVVEADIGVVRWWGSDTIGQYDHICDGTILNIIDYPELFGVIGTKYGGDGTTNFGLPNMKGIFPGAIGTQDVGGTVYGVAGVVGDKVKDDVKPHGHLQSSHLHSIGSHNHKIFSCVKEGSGVTANGLANTHATNNQNGFAGLQSGTNYNKSYITHDAAGHQLMQNTNIGNTNSKTPAIQSSTGVQSRPASLLGNWIIRTSNPALYEIPIMEDGGVTEPFLADNAVSARTVADDAITIRTLADEVLNLIHPVGEVYIQFPWKSDPNVLGFPGTWGNISPEMSGDFMRIEGGYSSGFEDGVQMDAMQRTTGSIVMEDANAVSTILSTSGAFSRSILKTSGPAFADRTAQDTYTTATFDCSNSVSPNPAKTSETETRPRNRTVRLWERTS